MSIVIEETKKWIKDVVIGHNFCPFASKSVRTNNVGYQIIKVDDLERFPQLFVQRMETLSTVDSTDTHLFVFDVLLNDFDAYLEVLDIAQYLLEEHGFEGVFQLASFHPRYQFEGTDFDDVTNFTNRSPFPIIQLIREEQITEALKHYPNPELIPERNMETAKRIFKSMTNDQ